MPVARKVASGEQVSAALLAIALNDVGVPARSMLGFQAKIRTDEAHTKARIKSIDGEALRKAAEDEVIVVAGFQGADERGNITTLGRGGSDTTAVALAAALGAPECEIFTDTDGVYTTDPHVIPSASKLDVIDYDEMLELASQGAKVLHPTSVWYARRYGVRIHVRSSFTHTQGTIVTSLADATEGSMLSHRPVTGVALDLNHARIDLHTVPDRPGVAAEIFNALGAAGVSVDMIIQGVRGAGDSRQQMAFIVNRDLVQDALEALRPALDAMGASAEVGDGVAKLSLVGIAIGSTPGIAGTMFEAVSAAGANIEMITTSEVRISVLIPAEHAHAALRSVHSAFGLEDGDETAFRRVLTLPGGNAEILMLGAEQLGAGYEHFAAAARDVAAAGIELYAPAGRDWANGAHGGWTPGLMLGLAGIGQEEGVEVGALDRLGHGQGRESVGLTPGEALAALAQGHHHLGRFDPRGGDRRDGGAGG